MPSPSGRRLRRLVRRLMIALSLAALAWVAFAYLAVNPLARWLLPRLGEQQLASQLQAERVALDPWRLALTVEGLHLARKDGAQLARVDRLALDFEASSLWRWAWHFRSIQVNAPRIHLEVDPDGRLNWAYLIAAASGAPLANATPSHTLPRVLIDRLTIQGGQLGYLERNRPQPLRMALQPLDLDLDLDLEEFSTLPSDSGHYLVQASLPEQGGRMRWKGDITLNPLASRGEVEASGLRLARLAQWARGVEPPQARITGEAQARFHYQLERVQGPGARGQASPYLLVQLEQLSVGLQEPAAEIRLGEKSQGRLQAEQIALTASHLALALQAKPKLTLDGVRLQSSQWNVQLQDPALAKPISLAMDEATINFGMKAEGPAWTLSGLGGELRGLSLAASGEAPLAQLARARLEGGTVDGAGRSAGLQAVTLTGLRAQALRPGPGQPFDWLALTAGLAAMTGSQAQAQALAESPRAAAPSPPKSAKQSLATTGGGWRASLARLSLTDAQVHLEDRSTSPAVAADVRSPSLELTHLSNDPTRPVLVKGRVQVVQGGDLQIEGRLTPAPLKADLQVRLADLSVRPLAPYLAQVARLRLDGGQLHLRGRLTLDDQRGALRGAFSGSAALRQLALSEEGGNASVLAWQEVSSDTVQLQLSPASVHLQELRVVRPVGRFIIYEDGTLNLTRLMRTAAPKKVAAPAQAPTASSGATPPDPGLAVAVDRVRVDSASLEFADLSLLPQFGTHINGLSGVINGLSNAPAAVAQVELDGRVEDFGSARVRGTVQPWRASEFTDLKLAFRNLEMSQLTPYAGKFAGRRIDAGRLSVDLEYKVKDRKLAGENKFVIQQLKLGERVDSPTALRLPLDLAIAVLQDSDGVIDLDIPISGSLDDPQFSYSGLVWKAITNVLTRIITAPFRALGNLLGGDSEKAGTIAFDAGSAVLAPQEQEKLLKIAEVLRKRTALRLTIVPAFETAADTRALQEQAMRRAVLEEAGVKLQPAEAPGPLDLSSLKVRSALERQLKSRSGGGRSFKLLDDMKDLVRSAKQEDLPRYQQMAEELRPTYPVTPGQLNALANARARALRDYLAGEARLPAARVSVSATPVAAGNSSTISSGTGKTGGAGGGEGAPVPLRLELTAASAAQVGAAGAPAVPAPPAR